MAPEYPGNKKESFAEYLKVSFWQYYIWQMFWDPVCWIQFFFQNLLCQSSNVIFLKSRLYFVTHPSLYSQVVSWARAMFHSIWGSHNSRIFAFDFWSVDLLPSFSWHAGFFWGHYLWALLLHLARLPQKCSHTHDGAPENDIARKWERFYTCSTAAGLNVNCRLISLLVLTPQSLIFLIFMESLLSRRCPHDLSLLPVIILPLQVFKMYLSMFP